MKKLLKSLIISSTLITASAYAESFQYQNNVHRYDDNTGKINVAGYVNRVSSSLAEQLTQNKNFANVKTTPIAIMSIVDMNNFKLTSPVSKRISENLIHEMQVRGYKVIDYKSMSNIKIDENGDYIFSRAIKDLKNQRYISYALSGTYANYRDGMAINCRIINIKTGVVLSTAQIFVNNQVIKSINYDNAWFCEPKVEVHKETVGIKQR